MPRSPCFCSLFPGLQEPLCTGRKFTKFREFTHGHRLRVRGMMKRLARNPQMLLPENSPLRRPPATFSRRQVLFLDGNRYAAEMAHIAYERLFAHLQNVAASPNELRVSDIATAMLDAWSIVDSAHRFRNLLRELPGLSNSPWKRLFLDRTADIETLRHSVQHQPGEVDGLISGGGQLWGYLSWAEVRNGRHTGKWLMMTGGSDFVGDEWFFIGPVQLPFEVPPGRVRLNAFGCQVYLGRLVREIDSAIASLTAEIESGAMRAVGLPATERRGADIVYEGWMQVLASVNQFGPGSSQAPSSA